MIKKLLTIFLSACIVSCSQEIDIPVNTGNGTDEGNSDVEEEVVYTYALLEAFLDNPIVSTRSTWEYDAYFPDGDVFSEDARTERRLYNASVLYFDSDMLLEHASVSVDYGTSMGGSVDNYSKEGNAGYTAIMLGLAGNPVTTGAHYFYTICNVPHAELGTLTQYFKDRIGVLTKDEFEKIVVDASYVVEATDIPLSATDDAYRMRCMMTNIVSPAPHYLAPPPGGVISSPESNNIKMNIGFSSVKVSLAYIPDVAATGTLSEVTYRLVNDPKQVYMMPNIFDGQVHTPHYDKNVTSSNFEDYFNPESDILSVTDNEKSPYYFRPASEENAKTWLYGMENGNESPLQGNSSMILVRAKYHPSQWLNPNGTEGEPDQDGTFWRIWSEASQRYLPGYYNAEPLVSGSNQVVKYESGFCYYPIWLQTDGKYMVARNRYYKIAITDVLNAGEPNLENLLEKDKPLEAGGLQVRTYTSGSKLPEATNNIRWQQVNN